MSSVELGQGSGRLYVPCFKLTSRFETEQLVVTCDFCGRFYARCCHHMTETCHNKLVVYTDGACSNNGRAGAVAGIGFAFGTGDTCQFSIPVDDALDPGGKRTSQRAELLAALEGLKKIRDYDREPLSDHFEGPKAGDDDKMIFVVTDSEYVVKGMSEWLPSWKRNGLRKANGQRPSNLDLFCKLDAEVEEWEHRHHCLVKFWHIDRAYNTIADKLAKRAARAAADAENLAFGGIISAVGALSL